MKEYEIFLPLWQNDGMRIDPDKLQEIRQELLAEFGGITAFPQPNLGFCKLGEITYRDEVIIYRVLAADGNKAREFFVRLKEQLKQQFRQEDVLIVERDVVAL